MSKYLVEIILVVEAKNADEAKSFSNRNTPGRKFSSCLIGNIKSKPILTPIINTPKLANSKVLTATSQNQNLHNTLCEGA